MTHARTQRVLIVVFDALRPEFVTPEIMPTLAAFAADGVTYTNSHSTFFTETRVNQSAVTSGTMPYRHGMVANKFVAFDAAPGAVLDTGDDAQLKAAFARMGGKLFGVPTLGQFLARHGRTYATLSAGTRGGGRLINHSAAADGTLRYTMRQPDATEPLAARAEIDARFGAAPGHDLPALDWITRAVDIYLDYIEPVRQPDVMLLWLCEPDESFHHLGIGSEGSLATIRHVDQAFGRILARHRAEIEAGTLQVIAMSDHGQIALEGQPIGVMQQMRDAGFRAGTSFDGGTDYVYAGANAGGIWVRDGDPALTARLAEWMLGQAWSGPMFTRGGVLGTLDIADVFLHHPRGPDIAFVIRPRGAANAHGRAGVSAHDSAYPDGGGSHGGLSRQELHNVLTLGGGAFKRALSTAAPAGNIDITPTVLAL
ncbi:MAG: alkaline phosphatase family protein, partial [Alphaproteobacteria bacterium]|nr:alkaline phosphatase family protein [Alphaproteobacteria bacterium]